MQNHEGDINSIIGNSSRAKEKSFFGFDEIEELFTERKPLKTGKTCHASKMTPPSGQKAKYQGDSELFVFVTLGMSDEGLKVFSQQAQEIGATLVIRGLVDSSFQKTHQRLKELAIPIDIDPTLFERFEITRVPTLVLAEIKDGKLTDVHDKVRGNTSIRSALELFSMEGDLFALAQSYLKKGQGA
jgi:conjugal transfer pilus assembly protein TrbC